MTKINSDIFDLAEANPKAICVRVLPYRFADAVSQIMHDRRTGYLPVNIDRDRVHLDDIVIEPESAVKHRLTCLNRRARRATQRAMKSNAAILSAGIIVFGHLAQQHFDKLDHETQIRAFRAVAQAIADFLNTTLTGLVIHRDETSVHAHFCMPAVNIDGYPISDANKKSAICQLQDLAAEVIAKFEPKIERGRRKVDRIKAGAKHGETDHMSTRQWNVLCRQARDEVKANRQELAELQARAEVAITELKTLSQARLADADLLAEIQTMVEHARTEASIAESKKRKAEEEEVASKSRAAAILEQAVVTAKAAADEGRRAAVHELHQVVHLAAQGLVMIKPNTGDLKLSRPLKDDLEKAVVQKIVKSPMIRPILNLFQGAISLLVDKIHQVDRLITRLKALENRMTQEEKAEVHEAEAILDEIDFNP